MHSFLDTVYIHSATAKIYLAADEHLFKCSSGLIFMAMLRFSTFSNAVEQSLSL